MFDQLAKTDWITPLIHGYAFVVLILLVVIWTTFRGRLFDLSRRVHMIANQVEGKPPTTDQAKIAHIPALLGYLGDLVERREDLELGPVLQFIRNEERQRTIVLPYSLVNVTETMIELFPMLGIFGTVWAISGVGAKDFSSDNLLTLFGTATTTTLFALMYVIFYKIIYAWFVQGWVTMLTDYLDKFQHFLAILEKQSRNLEFMENVNRNPWKSADVNL